MALLGSGEVSCRTPYQQITAVACVGAMEEAEHLVLWEGSCFSGGQNLQGEKSSKRGMGLWKNKPVLEDYKIAFKAKAVQLWREMCCLHGMRLQQSTGAFNPPRFSYGLCWNVQMGACCSTFSQVDICWVRTNGTGWLSGIILPTCGR